MLKEWHVPCGGYAHGRRGAVVVTTLHSNHVAHGGGVGAYHVLNSGDINEWVGA